MAALDLPIQDSMMLVQEYAYRTVAMDVVERYNLRTPQVAASFLTRCISSSARELSVNKVANEFKSRGSAWRPRYSTSYAAPHPPFARDRWHD